MTIETKAKVYGALVKAKGAIDKVSMTAVGAASAVGLTGISVSAVDGVTTTQPVIDVSSVDFTGLTNAITSMSLSCTYLFHRAGKTSPPARRATHAPP